MKAAWKTCKDLNFLKKIMFGSGHFSGLLCKEQEHKFQSIN